MIARFKESCPEIVIFLIAFFSPIAAAIVTVILLGFFDFLTGITAAYKRGNPITSRKMYASIIKVTMYSILIISSHMIELYLLGYLPLVKMATSTIALVELKSLYENISIITGTDIWNKVKKQIDPREELK